MGRQHPHTDSGGLCYNLNLPETARNEGKCPVSAVSSFTYVDFLTCVRPVTSYLTYVMLVDIVNLFGVCHLL